MIPMVDGGTHDDHGFALGLRGVVGELAAGAFDVGRLDAGDLLGPGRGVGDAGIRVILGDVLAAQATVDTVLRDLQVEDAGDQRLAAICQLDLAHRHIAEQQVVFIVVEMREADGYDFVSIVDTCQLGFYGVLRGSILLQQIPFTFLAPAETDTAVRHDEGAGLAVEYHSLPFRVVGFAHGAVEIGCAQETVRDISITLFAQHHLHRQVGIFAGVFLEIRVLFVDEELFQRDMTHGKEGCGIGTLTDRHPEIGKLDELCIIRRHGDDLGTLVAHFRGEMGVRRTGHRQVGAGDDNVGRVVPVRRFRHVGLLAPGLRAGGRQVAIPIVERTAGSTDEGEITRACGVGNHRHGGNR